MAYYNDYATMQGGNDNSGLPPTAAQSQPGQQAGQTLGPIQDSPMRGWYNEYLGRDPEPGAHAPYIARYGYNDTLRQSIYGSPEARAYRDRLRRGAQTQQINLNPSDAQNFTATAQPSGDDRPPIDTGYTPPPIAPQTPMPGGYVPPAVSPSGEGPGGYQAPTIAQQGAGPGKYNAPVATPSPFITPNGQIPAGVPYAPNTQMQGLQDNNLRNILSQDALSPEFVNRTNEAQKEMLLQRGQQASRALGQNAARRGTLAGGYQAGQQRRGNDILTSQLMQSQRDIANQAELANRQGKLNALAASESILGGREQRGLAASQFAEGIRQYNEGLRNQQSQFGWNADMQGSQLAEQMRQFDEGTRNRQAEYGFGSRLQASQLAEQIRQFNDDARNRQAEFWATHGLDTSRFAEQMRQFDENTRNRQAEYGSGLRYNYANLNSSLEQQFINALLGAGGR